MDNLEIEIHKDETVAHALHEESSQISSTETSSCCEVSDIENFWHQRMNDILATDGHEDRGGLASSTCSSPENYLDVSEWPKLGEDLHHEGEAGKRSNKVSQMLHVPRINKELPSLHEGLSDRQLLFERLELYNLVEKKIDGDGNCQFRALSDQLYQTSENYTFLREQVIDQLQSHPEIYEGYIPMPYDQYLKKMSRNGEWGDHITLQAAADLYGVKITVFTSFVDTCYVEILPAVQKSNTVLLLSFWAEVHYNSVYPDEGLELAELKKTKKKNKKKKWLLHCDYN